MSHNDPSVTVRADLVASSLPHSYRAHGSALPPHAFGAAVDSAALAEEFPTPPRSDAVFAELHPEELEQLRVARLRETVRRASNLPFYRERWDEVGLTPEDITSTSDLAVLPTFDVDDIRQSLEAAPPFGGHQSAGPGGWAREPHRIQFSGGTTGVPRPVLYTGADREVGSIMMARTLWAQDVRPGDVAVVSWGYGPHNAATIYTEAMYRWLGVLVIPASTGNVTSSEKQLEYAARYRATTLLATADYLLHLAKLAEELGYDLQEDFAFRSFPTIGDTDAVEEAWGRPAYNCYGTYEMQTCAAECRERGGLHVWEDGYILECVDVDDETVLPEGQRGNLVVTSLYSEAFPLVRFNTMDLSSLVPTSTSCGCGLPFAKIEGFQGRSDTMVKLRGINVWPEALGRITDEDPRTNGEYFCVAERQDGRDFMTVFVEVEGEPAPELELELADELQRRLGVRVDVSARPAGSLAESTGRGKLSKLRRFEDRR